MNPQYLNRELSWLAFNRRVLEEAYDGRNPILERCTFLGITASNLDEFFMVRMASLKQLVAGNYTQPDAAGLTPKEQYKAVTRDAHDFALEQAACRESLVVSLKREGIRLLRGGELNDAQRAWLMDAFWQENSPVLSPIAVDLDHPLPYLAGKKLFLAVHLAPEKKAELPRIFILPVPDALPRWIALPGEDTRDFVALEEAMGQVLPRLFEKKAMEGTLLFRLARDNDLSVNADARTVISEMEKSIKKRRWGHPVRLEWSRDFLGGADEWLRDFFTEKLELSKKELYSVHGSPDFGAFGKLASFVDAPQLRYEPQTPQAVPEFSTGESMFAVMARQDVLVHHPYQSFEPVIRLLQEAAADPEVVAIRQTLYRVSRQSPIIQALVDAAQSGKEVTVLVEVKARFDEENNIGWARLLEQAGCHVIYGVSGLKVHCKALMILRREGEGLRTYMHWGTGNYNDATAKIYTDLSLFTADPQLGQDAAALFSMLTAGEENAAFRRIHVAPRGLRSFLLERIAVETENAQRGIPARIAVKVNSMLDAELIEKLYRAAAAGVQVDLVVRGICAVVPGYPPAEGRIRVVSIVGRYLEHHRIFFFEDGGSRRVYIASADWMPRNLDKRVETCVPILDEKLKARVLGVLEAALADNQKARLMDEEGCFAPIKNADREPLDFQAWCWQMNREKQSDTADRKGIFARLRSWLNKGN